MLDAELNWAHVNVPDFSHYSVHLSTDTDRNYVHQGDTSEPRFVVPSLAAGTYYFVIYTHDVNGNTSVASDEMTFTI